ncbi:MAG: FeoB-associated Cys-rich membrane protein [Spirochaetales bacterium]|nr:FeoB-associated Cys-rich membrane protein [Spirochaetales bacterium]
MNFWDILIIFIVAGLILLAFKLARGRKSKGGCGCGCSECPQRKDCNSKDHAVD